MPNMETVRALVDAFNVNNYDFNAVKTNFKLQSEGKKDYIVVSFDKSMDTYQCRRYLDSIKRKIIREFYGIEESNDAEILDTAKLIFDVKSFPFDISRGKLSMDESGRFKFVTPVDEGVISNLKSHLAFSLKKDVQEGMLTYITSQPFDKKKYLWCGKFPNKESRKQFEREFLSRMKERYENVPKNPLKIEGNSVYIKDVFDDARLIDNVTRYKAWLVGIDLGVGNDVDHSVMLLKDSIINSFYQSTKTIVAGFMCASPLNREEASVLIPIMQNREGAKLLTKEEVRDINHAFNNVVLDDVSDKVQAEISVNGSNVLYGIDFSNKEISHCVITKIIESSVINKDHELAIDPELRLQALSPAQSPFNSPTHAEPSGLETPPNQRKRNRDSGIGESPLKLEDFGVQSPVRVPDGYLSEAQLESPTRSQNVALEGPPRQESEKEKEKGGLLYYHVDPDGPSGEFPPRSHLSYTAVSYGVSGPSSSVQSVGAVQNVQAGTSAWDQPIGAWSSPAPSAEPSLWQPSRSSSWKGASESMRTGKSMWYVPSSYSPGVEDVNDVEPEKQQVSDECSEAKSQKSESPKEHGGIFKSKIKSFFSLNSNPKQHEASLKRCDVGRDTTRSMPTISVTKKPPLSERFASERKAKSNPPSGVTSPTHEGASGGLKPLTNDEKKELRLFLRPELQKKLDSNSFSPGEEQHLYLTHTPSGKRAIKNSFENPEENLRRSVKAQLPGDRSSQASADSGLGKSLERGQSPLLIEKFSDKLLINSRVDSPNIKKHLQKEKEVFV